MASQAKGHFAQHRVLHCCAQHYWFTYLLVYLLSVHNTTLLHLSDLVNFTVVQFRLCQLKQNPASPQLAFSWQSVWLIHWQIFWT